MRLIAAASLVLPMLLLAGCQARDRGLEWLVEFEDSALEGRARVFEAAIIDQGCASGERATFRYRTAFGADESPPNPLALPPGNYGFSVRVRDANCVVYAETCTVELLPRTDGETIVSRLAPRSEEAACTPAECNLGNCTADDTVDAGRPRDAATDSAIDAPVDAPIDAPGMDASPDSSADTGPLRTFSWTTSGWSGCSASCGTGTQTRTVSCIENGGSAADPSSCTEPMPAASRGCDAGSSTCGWGSWGSYGACSAVCDGTQNRTRSCNVAGHCAGASSESQGCETGSCCDQIGSCTAFVMQSCCATSTGKRCETRQCITSGTCSEERDVGTCIFDCPCYR